MLRKRRMQICVTDSREKLYQEGGKGITQKVISLKALDRLENHSRRKQEDFKSNNPASAQR
jgi:hypothetical protein